MSAPDVLAVMDRCVEILHHNAWGEDREDLEEARAAVAEAFAERDRLRNIVRSHEAQILRMTAERAAVAELIEAGKFLATNPLGMITPGALNRWNAALARAGGAK